MAVRITSSESTMIGTGNFRVKVFFLFGLSAALFLPEVRDVKSV